jgi:hypothetical protein
MNISLVAAALALALAAAAEHPGLSLRGAAFGASSVALARARELASQGATPASAPSGPAQAEDVESIVAQISGNFKSAFDKDVTTPEEYFKRLGAADAWVSRLLAADPKDGHGLYFRCEIIRKTAKLRGKDAKWSDSHMKCLEYLETEHAMTPEQAGHGQPGSRCYQPGTRGYCGERTGWITHMVANDFFKQWAVSGQRYLLEEAAQLVEITLKRHPAGFGANGGLVPTHELREKIAFNLIGP